MEQQTPQDVLGILKLRRLRGEAWLRPAECRVLMEQGDLEGAELGGLLGYAEMDALGDGRWTLAGSRLSTDGEAEEYRPPSAGATDLSSRLLSGHEVKITHGFQIRALAELIAFSERTHRISQSVAHQRPEPDTAATPPDAETTSEGSEENFMDSVLLKVSTRPWSWLQGPPEPEPEPDPLPGTWSAQQPWGGVIMGGPGARRTTGYEPLRLGPGDGLALPEAREALTAAGLKPETTQVTAALLSPRCRTELLLSPPQTTGDWADQAVARPQVGSETLELRLLTAWPKPGEPAPVLWKTPPTRQPGDLKPLRWEDLNQEQMDAYWTLKKQVSGRQPNGTLTPEGELQAVLSLTRAGWQALIWTHRWNGQTPGENESGLQSRAPTLERRLLEALQKSSVIAAWQRKAQTLERDLIAFTGAHGT